MKLTYGLSAFERAEGDLAEMPVVNMYAEVSDTEGSVLQSRPGLIDSETDQGAGPVAEVLVKDGVLSGAVLSVSGGNFYHSGVSKGVIDGSGPVSITGNETGAFITAGATAYFYDGTTLATIAFPDGANVTKMLEIGSRIIALRAGTGKFYWTSPLGSTFAALDFATAEIEPDKLLDAVAIDDILVLFGVGTVEFWPNTGDANLPFAPLEGRVFEKGIRETSCAAIVGSSFVWVGNDNVVYANGNAPTPISNPGLEKKIADSAACKIFPFFIEGAECVALRLDKQTYYQNNRTALWHEMASYGQSNWIPQCYSGGYFGSSLDGKLLRFGGVYSDLDGVLERRFRAGFPLNGGGVSLNNMRLRANAGQTPNLTGEYTDPIVEMRASRDGGQTWGNWKQRKLGMQGKYRQRIEWLALGMFSQPGGLFEFRVSDPVPFRVSEVLANEPLGGF